MDKYTAAVLLFISSMGFCHANLGDTEAQCIARYGAELDVQTDVGYRQVGDKAASFNVKTASETLSIRVIFLHGSSCHESISNADTAQGLSQDRMKALLVAQGPALKWSKGKTLYQTDQQADETYEAENWLRSDDATAVFTMTGKASSRSLSGQLELSTKQYADAQHFYDKENGDG
jgi:hypothetical protein